MADLIYGVATAAASTGFVPVKVGGQVVSALANRDVTYAAGDLISLGLMGSTWVALARLFTTAAGNTDTTLDDDPAPAPVTRFGQTTFVPQQTGSWRDSHGGWRTDNDDVYQGEFGANGNYIGCWFYGFRPATLVGKTVTDAWVRVRRRQDTGGDPAASAATLGHIAEGTKPSGEPTFGGGITGPALLRGAIDTHFTIPVTLAQSLVGATYGGLGVHIAGATPYLVFSGLSRYAGSGALTIVWHT